MMSFTIEYVVKLILAVIIYYYYVLGTTLNCVLGHLQTNNVVWMREGFSL